MKQPIKLILLIGCVGLGFQSAWGFSLLGPRGANGVVGGTLEDNWQITTIGYNPLPNVDAPPFIGTIDHTDAPKNIGEGYRCNTPVLYYTFDADFYPYFGPYGEKAVEEAFDILNGVFNGQTNTPMAVVSANTGVLMGATNGVFNGPSVALSPANGLDKYSTNLTEFPLNSQAINYQAQVLGLTDLKSATMSLMLYELGLADAVRYTWGLLGRWQQPGSTCTPPTPPSQTIGAATGVAYWVIQRNFDIVPSALTNYQYSPYVNSTLYSYYIWENCGVAAPYGPPAADALEIPVDPLNNNNYPVASGIIPGEGFMGNNGVYYTGLTRDDVAGLRYLMSTNNFFDQAAGFQEPPASGSTLVSGVSGGGFTNLDDQFYLNTSNLTVLILEARTNNPAALQALYPGNPPDYGPLVISSVTTNLFNGTYTYTFANVYTNHAYSPTPVEIQVITTNIGPQTGYGAPYPPIIVTNVTTTTTTVQSNIVSGDFFLIPTNTCGLDILDVVATNVVGITNTLGTATNITVNSTNYITTNFVVVSTNYTLLVAPCELPVGSGGTNLNMGDYQGIGRMQFVRVSDSNYDSLSGTFLVPITNQYTMVETVNGQLVTRTFQRVLTRPDIVFGAQSLLVGSGNADLGGRDLAYSQPNFIDSRAPNLAGPGIIDPTTGTNISIVFNDVGPVYVNLAPGFMTGPDHAYSRASINWASFVGSTNPPIVFPNGSSMQNLANLAAAAFVQVSPPPPAVTIYTNSVGYVSTNIFSATGGQPPYNWTLATNSMGLPPGLTLSSSGVISGTTTQGGTYDNIVIQTADSSSPSAIVLDTTYSMTIH